MFLPVDLNVREKEPVADKALKGRNLNSPGQRPGREIKYETALHVPVWIKEGKFIGAQVRAV